MEVEGIKLNISKNQQAVRTQVSAPAPVQTNETTASSLDVVATQESIDLSNDDSSGSNSSVIWETENGKEEKLDEGRSALKLMEKAVESANQSLAFANRSLSYSYHKKTNRISVKVIDTESKKVIREIPPEKALDAFAKVLELNGLLLDEKS